MAENDPQILKHGTVENDPQILKRMSEHVARTVCTKTLKRLAH